MFKLYDFLMRHSSITGRGRVRVCIPCTVFSTTFTRVQNLLQIPIDPMNGRWWRCRADAAWCFNPYLLPVQNVSRSESRP